MIYINNHIKADHGGVRGRGGDVMRKDKVVRLLKMGRHNLIRSEDQSKDTLIMEDKKMEDNFVKSEEEEEVGDVISRLFDWDFDQLLRQVVKL